MTEKSFVASKHIGISVTKRFKKYKSNKANQQFENWEVGNWELFVNLNINNK